MSKPSIPQGTRDFPATVLRKRNHILSNIRQVFELYGFQPLETPAMENLETLMGKYGEEGDKLIFKVLNNGLGHEKNIEKAKAGFEKVLEGKSSADVTERALKYDLTIPFARYVAMNHAQLTFPYKRYQVQPVWRADRPQRGRYREFTQCDADVVGSTALINEVELACIYDEAFTRLGLTGYELLLNSRNILLALAIAAGGAEQMTNISIAIDKLDKIGLYAVKEELAARGLTAEQITLIEQYLCISGSNEEKLAAIQHLLGAHTEAQKGIAELQYVLGRCGKVNAVVDFTLARGLNYYTGIIFEAKAPATVKMGSIGGGGRYDDLTGLFGVPGIPGVGISFGIDRIYDVMEEMNLFPEDLQTGTQVLFFNMGETEAGVAFELMQELRQTGIPAELFHEPAKVGKQFTYAEKKGVPYVVIIGSREAGEKVAQVKKLSNGDQQTVAFAELANYFKK
jgi:histidyl-tRNA synthetase